VSEEKDINEIEAKIDEDGHRIVASLAFKGLAVRERISREIHKLTDEEQLAELEKVTQRLRKKLQRKLVRENPAYGVAIKRGRVDPERLERLAQVRAAMAKRIRERVKKPAAELERIDEDDAA
jgi:hypothetical protein